ncbi:putative lipoprotein [Melioribacter roseus P3M-2]|uniref:Putative lipoprotein n=1 Tax=Melioribacter roseus (strain DSM 23840 / JCM 17771 / VKM B-2668 / P3M-2) TaxID=1191523 RepID=I7A3Y5_MELRP|nr:lipoprotein [Melioribacter roseus]AFN74611.1 putative lipoprotein [Melioribacter roseus P3M-2]
MNKNYCLLILFLGYTLIPAQDTLVWKLNNPDTVGNFKTSYLTDRPSVINTEYGEALIFDGVDDGILVNANPLGNADSFTIEVFFRPDSSSDISNYEQRFIHIKNSDDSRRILIELRLKKNRWTLDTFIKNGDSKCTLIDTSIWHEAGKWYKAALSYTKGIMKHSVNGREGMRGKIDFEPIGDNGTISIGVRQNKKSWFKGIIREIKFIR